MELRRQRRELIADRIALFTHDIELVRAQASRQDRADDRLRLLQLARQLSRSRHIARHELHWRQALPVDRPRACRCGDTRHHVVDDWPPAMVIDTRG